MRILVVDDDPIQRKLLQTILTTRGHEPASAGDGVEALEALRSGESFDAVITDVLMPRLDGYRLCYAIRRDESLRHLPVVVYTASYTSPSDEKLARTAGADVFLRKPADADKILETLERVVREPRGQYAAFAPEAEFELLKQYSEGLVKKLEDRNIELEAAHARLLEINDSLRKSETRFFLAFHASPVATSISEGETSTLLDVNEQFLRILGYTREEILGHSSVSLKIWADEETHREFVRNVKSDGAVRDRRTKLRTRTGELRDVVGSVVAVSVGGQSRFLSTFIDITDRERAEQALRESEERYRVIFDASPLPTWLFETPGLKIYDVNQATIDMYGYTREEFRTMTLYDLRTPEEAERLRAMYVETPRPPLRWDPGVWQHRKKDGTLVLMDVHTHEVEVAGRRMRLAVQIDVTEKHRLEAHLRQSQKMEAVGLLAGGIAHDFNNILTTILGYGSLALERIDKKDPLHEEILEIQRAGERAAELTKKLLAFSRKQILDPRVIDLNATVAGVERMLRRIIGEDVELLFRPAADLGRVRADPGQVEQVLMNLGVNARDAMPSGGALTIETANVELDEEYTRTHADVPVTGPYVLLAVSDSGCGMDAETRARMFEPFFTTKELGKGTGLGLSTVYGIVKQSGGYIWCYSEPGMGTAFKVYFPRVADDFTATPAPSVSANPQGSETILLVEDEETLANLARRVLLKQGYHVLTARSGAEAREVAAANSKIDLLLTDVVMPGMGGRELAEALLRELPTLRVLYMSGYTDDAIVHHGFLDAGLAFLQKPFTPDGLAKKVREVLRGEK